MAQWVVYRSARTRLYEDLGDLNFEYKAGKLSEEDYATQRVGLQDERAGMLAEMEAIEKTRLRKTVTKGGRA